MLNEDLPTQEGKINYINVIERQGDNLIKFKLDSVPHEFSLFGEFPFREGDFIKFKYLIKDGRWYNVKELMDYNKQLEVGEDEEILKVSFDDRTIKALAIFGGLKIDMNNWKEESEKILLEIDPSMQL